MSYLFFNTLKQEEFDGFVEKHEYCNLLQSYNWAKVKSNWDHMYTGVYKNNELVATGLVLIKRLPLSFCMYYLPRGPIMDYKDKELVQYCFDQLKKLAKKDHCIFIKFDSAIHVNDYDSKSYNINRYKETETSVYKGYKQDKIEMRGDRAEMSDLPLYLNTVAGGLDRRDQTIGGFSFIVKIYAVPVVEIIG